jgi:ABC-type multidrug transport system ATPase subunit
MDDRTHLLSGVERISDRIVVLDRGRKKAEGTLDDLRRQVDLGPGADLESGIPCAYGGVFTR